MIFESLQADGVRPPVYGPPNDEEMNLHIAV